jgi:ubiquinone/menaquinone biosynthesis C-methylase UbiE
LGDDAEELARRGFEATAFDISETAIKWCKRRFGKSRVKYFTADLFQAPQEWTGAFDFVLESYTLQVLPAEARKRAIQVISRFVQRGGTLLVISRGREPDEPAGKMPWPLVRSELDEFLSCGLKQISFEDYMDKEVPPVRRFRVVYVRG